MTANSIMSFRLVKIRPTDKVRDALHIMHQQQIRNLPVVDEDDFFIGLFGVRRLVELLLPKAAQMKLGLKDLSFMPDELGEIYARLQEIGEKPVSDFLEKKKSLQFCKPSTTFPEVLELLSQSSDSSMPVIVLKGKHKRLVGMVSAWDVLEKLVISTFNEGPAQAEDAAGADEGQPETGRDRTDEGPDDVDPSAT